VFDRPPEGDLAARRVLLIHAASDGTSWTATLEDGKVLTHQEVSVSVAATDATGGIVGKIDEAMAAARGGVEVRIVRLGSPSALQAILDEGPPAEGWVGTVVVATEAG
jgi:isopentenyl phosphate kinase